MHHRLHNSAGTLAAHSPGCHQFKIRAHSGTTLVCFVSGPLEIQLTLQKENGTLPNSVGHVRVGLESHQYPTQISRAQIIGQQVINDIYLSTGLKFSPYFPQSHTAKLLKIDVGSRLAQDPLHHLAAPISVAPLHLHYPQNVLCSLHPLPLSQERAVHTALAGRGLPLPLPRAFIPSASGT